MKIIDLRSDTVTRPSPQMRQAIFEAVVGDDVFGDDPTVIELENYAAQLLGKQSALFVPSGTMGNQICLRALSEPGWEMLCDRQCHVVNYEVAGPAVHSNLLVNLITTEYGMISADVVRSSIRPKNIHCPLTKIVTLENTHNHHGGTVLPHDEILEVKKVCDEFDLIMHLDGARIWNAHVATGIPLPELTAPFESVSACLSKGLGAPIGSVVAGTTEFIVKCRRERKLFGGGMRQVGILAAAGLYALKNNISRLAEDHANARYLAEGLAEFTMLEIPMDRIQTNIVLVNIASEDSAAELLEKLKKVGVLGVQFGPKQIRFVTHLDLSHEDCVEVLHRIKAVVS